jgi:hypothetical protein
VLPHMSSSFWWQKTYSWMSDYNSTSRSDHCQHRLTLHIDQTFITPSATGAIPEKAAKDTRWGTVQRHPDNVSSLRFQVSSGFASSCSARDTP